jgi:nicotinate-nucleotide adenylyltransferase
MDVGLFFGSFNPIHTGHLIIAQTVLDAAQLREVWFIVSPQNPFKKAGNLAHELDRLRMVELAIEDNWQFRASDIEFHMPLPSYTSDTLAWLSDRHPGHTFKVIMGADNLRNFSKWKNHEVILEQYGLVVYPRPGFDLSALPEHPKVQRIDAPLMDISATHIRQLVTQDKRPRYLLAEPVIDYIFAKGLYRK